MIPPVIADTGGLLRALARTPEGKASFPEYRRVLISAASVIVPGLILAELDYFRGERQVMRKLVGEIFDPATRYEYDVPLPSDIARALELDAKFAELELGLVDGWWPRLRNAVGYFAFRPQTVLTTDQWDFSAIRVGPRLTQTLELLP